MRRETQIEERECGNCLHHYACALNSEYLPTPCDAYESKAGYRKQSAGEWISVEERLPETEGWYLVYTAPDKKHRSVNKAEFCKGFEWNNFEPYWRGAGGNWGNVTHWMPLPEPPEMKGV